MFLSIGRFGMFYSSPTIKVPPNECERSTSNDRGNTGVSIFGLLFRTLFWREPKLYLRYLAIIGAAHTCSWAILSTISYNSLTKHCCRPCPLLCYPWLSSKTHSWHRFSHTTYIQGAQKGQNHSNSGDSSRNLWCRSAQLVTRLLAYTVATGAISRFTVPPLFRYWILNSLIQHCWNNGTGCRKQK